MIQLLLLAYVFQQVIITDFLMRLDIRTTIVLNHSSVIMYRKFCRYYRCSNSCQFSSTAGILCRELFYFIFFVKQFGCEQFKPVQEAMVCIFNSSVSSILCISVPLLTQPGGISNFPTRPVAGMNHSAVNCLNRVSKSGSPPDIINYVLV